MKKKCLEVVSDCTSPDKKEPIISKISLSELAVGRRIEED
jgi:hypothetical protein